MFESGDLIWVTLPCGTASSMEVRGMYDCPGFYDHCHKVQYHKVLVEWGKETMEYEVPYFKINTRK